MIIKKRLTISIIVAIMIILVSFFSTNVLILKSRDIIWTNLGCGLEPCGYISEGCHNSEMCRRGIQAEPRIYYQEIFRSKGDKLDRETHQLRRMYDYQCYIPEGEEVHPFCRCSSCEDGIDNDLDTTEDAADVACSVTQQNEEYTREINDFFNKYSLYTKQEIFQIQDRPTNFCNILFDDNFFMESKICC